MLSDAVEAPGQYVQKKAADELVLVKPHRLRAARTRRCDNLSSGNAIAGVVGCNEAAVPCQRYTAVIKSLIGHAVLSR
jgi:hypothetical protein